MLSSDREEFVVQIKMLCAGHNVPATPERIDAYWTGLAKMPLSGVVRCVEYALGENGPDKLPTVPAMWKTYKTVRTPSRETEPGKDPRLEIIAKASKLPLSIWQRGAPWSWIVRWSPGVDHSKVAVAEYGAAYLGVIIPQCHKEPEAYPAVRVML